MYALWVQIGGSQRRGTLLGSVIFNLPQIFCFAKSLREPYVILMTVSLKYEVYALWVQIDRASAGEPCSAHFILEARGNGNFLASLREGGGGPKG